MPGPFYFAWVDPDETTFGPEHHVEDELVHSFEITHEEGQLPMLSIGIKNPKVGLLAPGRKLWAWLSCLDAGHVQPLFFGRLVGIPDSIINEVVTLQIIAKPLDYLSQKQALAEHLKVRPWYDPIFIDEAHRDDPDTVLEGYSALWHVDRITHEVTISDIIVGEDGEVEFTENDAFYDGVEIMLGATPLVQVDVDATVSWTQTYASAVLGTKQVTILSYGGSAFYGGWPKPGKLDGGWTILNSWVSDNWGVSGLTNVTKKSNWKNHEKTHTTGDTMSLSSSKSAPPIVGGDTIYTDLIQSNSTGFVDPFGDPPLNLPSKSKTSTLYVPLWSITGSLTLGYDASSPRTERLLFSLRADMQPILTLPESPDQSDHEIISLTGSDVGVPIEGELPIGAIERGSYFPQDRGLWSVEYLLAVARAHLLNRARAVHVKFETRFENVIGLSCRMNARLFDHRLPGGKALGKIIHYSMAGDGDTGKIIGTITIACAIGYGDSVTGSPGIPDYVDEGYVDPGYQHYHSTIVVLGSNDIGYSIPAEDHNNPGLKFPLSMQDAIGFEAVGGSRQAEVAAIYSAIPYLKAAAEIGEKGEGASAADQVAAEGYKQMSIDNAMKNDPAARMSYVLGLKPVAGVAFANEYGITTTVLTIPKQIDLEAPSSP